MWLGFSTWNLDFCIGTGTSKDLEEMGMLQIHFICEKYMSFRGKIYFVT
jgi:hypothetical protein